MPHSNERLCDVNAAAEREEGALLAVLTEIEIMFCKSG